MHQPIEHETKCPLCSGSRGFAQLWDATSGNYLLCHQCHRRVSLDGKAVMTIQDLQALTSSHSMAIEGLIRENMTLKERLCIVETQLRDVIQKTNEVYYAPGMPGCIKAHASFSSTDLHDIRK